MTVVGSSFGHGTYFTNSLSKALTYSEDRCVILAKVVTGNSMPGRPNLFQQTLPPKVHSALATQTHSLGHEDFVVFSKFAAYPHYIARLTEK